ncbi:aspartate/glutamate racemase family protein, partial [Candidatus Saccharibacteria bacterium]|nr:aspartate/glutamate racemase family protein [Candidatus Saccharibacteria bacterium]
TRDIESYGATIIGIACNTAHAYLGEIVFNSPNTKIVDLIDSVANTVKDLDPGSTIRYGLLTSRGTRDSHLYRKYLNSYGVKCVEATNKQQALLDETIDLIMSHKNKRAKAKIGVVIDQMRDKGIDHFIAGCTELPIALSGGINGANIVDSNWVLAKTLVDLYYTNVGRKSIRE